jgi:hypothetical protein
MMANPISLSAAYKSDASLLYSADPGVLVANDSIEMIGSDWPIRAIYSAWF